MSGEKEKTVKSEPARHSWMVWVLLLIFLGGIFTAFLLRFLLVNNHTTHYHANFAVYVNGQRDTFENFTFYEEVAACSADGSDNPRTRVHMHNSVSDVIHVHDTAVTWGHFFANLGYTLGNKILVTNNGTFIDGQDGKSLRFILNGKSVSIIANEVIHSEDALLVDYGNDDAAQLQIRYESIERNAAEYNSRQDPSSCKGGENESFTDRVRRTIGIEPSH